MKSKVSKIRSFMLVGATLFGAAPACDLNDRQVPAEELTVRNQTRPGLGPGAECIRHGYDNCAEGLMCEHGALSPAACPPYYMGTCVDPRSCKASRRSPGATPSTLQCGCDGVTYVDECARMKAGATLYSDGPCPAGA